MLSDQRNISEIESKYRVIAQLGQGGAADVSLAVALGIKGFTKLVVLKSMRPQFHAEPEFAEMFMVEARLAARLSHPNVVQTNEVFDFDGLPVIVMEYLEGQPLSAVIAKARGGQAFPLAMHLRVLSEALAGLHYSHELKEYDGTPMGVVHRDVSPQNVFLTYDGQVKVLDFGIAKINASQVETAHGVLKGKLPYMPAEQITDEGVDRRCDVYAVGVMLWEAAVGRRLWGSASEATIMNAVLNGEVPKPSSVAPDVDPELERIVLRAMAQEPSDRYPTAAAFQAELEQYVANMGSNIRVRDIGATVSSLFEEIREEQQKAIQAQLATVMALSQAELERYHPIALGRFEATATGNAGPTRAERRNKPLWIGLATLLALGSAGMAWAALGPNGAPRAEPVVTQPARVTLRVAASPASAQVSIDGELLGNPVTRDYSRDPERRVQVVASASGHESESRSVELGQNLELVIELAPLPVAPSSAEVAAPVPVPSAKPVSTKPRPKVTPTRPGGDDCATPYYIDERGVKKFKRNCL
ncbi:MAG TPA: protein kinase [Polyangiaceae bacterium]|nr:protein kinase [Polyangiaceae bacterium]